MEGPAGTLSLDKSKNSMHFIHHKTFSSHTNIHTPVDNLVPGVFSTEVLNQPSRQIAARVCKVSEKSLRILNGNGWCILKIPCPGQDPESDWGGVPF